MHLLTVVPIVKAEMGVVANIDLWLGTVMTAGIQVCSCTPWPL